MRPAVPRLRVYTLPTCPADDTIAQVRALSDSFASQAGRRARILIAKLGLDGHDRGARAVATGFADVGFDVDVGPLFQSPEEVVRQAIENDVHVIGLSSLAGAHQTLVPELLDGLRAAGYGHILVVLGGIVPDADRAALKAAGVVAVFGPGTVMASAAQVILERLVANL